MGRTIPLFSQRNLNQKADLLSRCRVNNSAWCLNQDIYYVVQSPCNHPACKSYECEEVIILHKGGRPQIRGTRCLISQLLTVLFYAFPPFLWSRKYDENSNDHTDKSSLTEETLVFRVPTPASVEIRHPLTRSCSSCGPRNSFYSQPGY